jgi:hypothetical protein
MALTVSLILGLYRIAILLWAHADLRLRFSGGPRRKAPDQVQVTKIRAKMAENQIGCQSEHRVAYLRK